jgi:hypothetical protein
MEDHIQLSVALLFCFRVEGKTILKHARVYRVLCLFHSRTWITHASSGAYFLGPIVPITESRVQDSAPLWLV